MNPWRLNYDPRKGDRVTLETPGQLDEIVYMSRNGGTLFHVEQMDRHQWWAQIGDAYVSIFDGKGGIRVGIRRGEYGEALGHTEFVDVGLGRVCCEHGRRK